MPGKAMLGKAVLFFTMSILSFAILGQAGRVEDAAGFKGTVVEAGKASGVENAPGGRENAPGPKRTEESRFPISSFGATAEGPGEAGGAEDAPGSGGTADNPGEARAKEAPVLKELQKATLAEDVPGSEGIAEGEASSAVDAPGSKETANIRKGKAVSLLMALGAFPWYRLAHGTGAEQPVRSEIRRLQNGNSHGDMLEPEKASLHRIHETVRAATWEGWAEFAKIRACEERLGSQGCVKEVGSEVGTILDQD